MPAQLQDFGSAYAIWTFLGERLNKTLKSFNNNGLKGGQRELIMLRSFLRNLRMCRMVSSFRAFVASRFTNKEYISSAKSSRVQPGRIHWSLLPNASLSNDS